MPGSNYLVARSLDRATDESSSARRVSSNGNFVARLVSHPTDDPLLVARIASEPMKALPNSESPLLCRPGGVVGHYSPGNPHPVHSRTGERSTR